MSRSSDRAQVEPIPALVAVLVLGTGLSIYAGLLGAVGADQQRSLAEPVIDRVHDDLVVSGVADPDRLSTAAATSPDEYTVAVTLSTHDETWRAGAASADGSDEANRSRNVQEADRAERRVSVRVETGTVRAGTLSVEVWS